MTYSCGNKSLPDNLIITIVSTCIKYIVYAHVLLIKMRLSWFAVPLLPEGGSLLISWIKQHFIFDVGLKKIR